MEESGDEDKEGDAGSTPTEDEVERLLRIRWVREASNKYKELMDEVLDMEDELPGPS